jgi:hypothetical protein
MSYAVREGHHFILKILQISIHIISAASFGSTDKRALLTSCIRGISQVMTAGLAEAGANISSVPAVLALEGSETEQAVRAAPSLPFIKESKKGRVENYVLL